MNSPDIGEQAISKAAEIGLKSQLDEVEDIHVDINADPLDLMQGKMQSVSIKGQGLIMKQELRAEKIHIETVNIDINPIKAALGHIELNSQSDARVLVVLKEEDIQRAFNCEYVLNKLSKLNITYKGKVTTVKVEKVKFQIPEMGKVSLDAVIRLIEENNREHVGFTAIPKVNSSGNSVILNSVQYDREAEYNQEVAQAIVKRAEEILDLRNFELKSMSMQVRRLDVRVGKLSIEADAVVKDFPNVS